MAARSLLLLPTSLALSCASSQLSDRSEAPEAPQAPSLRAQINVDRRQFEPVSPGVLGAHIPGVLQGELSAEGLLAWSPDDDELGLRTASLNGRALVAAPPTLGACAPTSEWIGSTCAPAAELAFDGLTEWWTPSPTGLHQGWILHEPAVPGAAADLALRVEVLRGELLAVDADGQGASLLGSTGRLWRYEGLLAWDAHGKTLPARLEAAGAHLMVRVDARGGVWPITVDPSLGLEDATSLISSDVAYNDLFGISIAGAGDVDGDGYADLVVGASDDEDNGELSGSAYVYYGSATGISTASEDKLLASDGSKNDQFGIAVSGAGDIDGDGYDDVVIGAYTDNVGASSTGSAYVYYGSATGISLASEDKLSASDAGRNDYLGYALAGGGDLDGDGYSDLVIGAYGDDDQASNAGAVYVWFGSSSGVDATSEQKLSASDGAAGASFGFSVDSVGDLNGDGYDDLVVGAYLDPGSAKHSGSVYVYYGSATGPSASSEQKLLASDGDKSDYFGYSVSGAGDVDGDGYADLVVGAYGDSDAGSEAGSVYLYYGSATGSSAASEDKLLASDGEAEDEFGYQVAGAGDIDGDGYADIVVGSILDDDEDTNAGAAYVYYGSATGIVSSTEAKLTIAGSDLADLVGSSVAGVGDLDGDGFDELAVGSGVFDGAYYNSGTVVLFNGGCRVDADDDGACDHQDCDDSDDSFYPGAPETVGDGLDQDCDGQELCYADADSDGYTDESTVVSADMDCTDSGEASPTTPTGDCDDGDASAYPGAADTVGDEEDSDCDGVETCYADADDDGYTDGATTVASSDTDCTDAGEGTASDPTGDCDDSDAAFHPGATEGVGDEIDQDCDETEICYADADNDGYTDGATTVASSDTDCTDSGEGTSSDPTGDCDDDDAAFSPGATEGVGDEVDQDCDGTEICYADADDDGYTDGATEVASSDTDCTDAGEGTASDPTGDCDDGDAAFSPSAVEGVGDEIDQDCDGTEVCYADLDDDGFTDGVSEVASSDTDCTDSGEGTATDPATDCDDADASTFPGATEGVGDEVDSDCDGQELCYVDGDADGFSDGISTAVSADGDCEDPSEAAADLPTGDCDDADPTVNPGATEGVGDDLDQDCDGAELCYADADQDGYTDGSTVSSPDDLACDGAGELPLDGAGGDCDDNDDALHPGATEQVGDEVDSDCDGHELCYADADNDGYAEGSTTRESADTDCDDTSEASAADPAGDCDDLNNTVHPGAAEVAGDGIDQDCDGVDAEPAEEPEGAGQRGDEGKGGSGSCSSLGVIAPSPLLALGVFGLVGIRRRRR